MSPSGYVRLKHALSAVALRAVHDPQSGTRAARAFAAYVRLGGDRPVPIADLARAAGTAPDEIRRLFTGTGVFDDAGSDRLVLAAPCAPHAAYVARQTARIADAVRILEGPPPAGMPAAVWRGVALFNARLFFECHEYFEDAWRGSSGPERAFYHGLIQAAAACYHWEKGNRHGTRILAGKALEKLRAFPPAHDGIDVGGLLTGLEALRAAGARADVPVIAFASGASRRTRPRRA